MSTNDKGTQALAEIREQMRKNQQIKQQIVQAGKSRHHESLAQLLKDILGHPVSSSVVSEILNLISHL
jgi:hypothetical protein